MHAAPGRMLGEAAPAAADFQHACRLQRKRIADMRVLGPAPLPAKVAAAAEQRGRIAPGVVEPQRVERVAQIVVRVDIARLPARVLRRSSAATAASDASQVPAMVRDRADSLPAPRAARPPGRAVDPAGAIRIGKTDIAGAQDRFARASRAASA
jgi:hypothetical protein